MKNNKTFILIMAIVDIVVLIVVLVLLFIKLGMDKIDKDHTSVSSSGVVSIDKDLLEDGDTDNGPIESIAAPDKDKEPVDSDADPDNDYSQNVDLSIFDTPFGDGYEFPDLSDYEFIFIGDSIFDMYNSPTSMPRQLEVYTNSTVYNFSKNMSCAGENTNNQVSLTGLTSSFLGLNDIGKDKPGSFNTDIERFKKNSHKGKKMVIIFEHCINDYTFSSPLSNPSDPYDINSYEGSLRSNISRIMKEYPKATYVYMEPYILGVNNLGNDPNTFGYSMNDYIASLEKISGEFGIRLFNLRAYDFFKEYRDGYLLEDGVHPNDMCAKTMARLWCDYLINNIQ